MLGRGGQKTALQGLTRAAAQVRLLTMARKPAKPTITELLRESLTEADSLSAVARATGVQKASLIRFVSRRQSLRLDMADKLAAHFEIEVRRKRRT